MAKKKKAAAIGPNFMVLIKPTKAEREAYARYVVFCEKFESIDPYPIKEWVEHRRKVRSRETK